MFRLVFIQDLFSRKLNGKMSGRFIIVMNLKNPNRWFLLLSSLIMISVAGIGYLLPGKSLFASEGMTVLLYRLNYAILTWIVLATGNDYFLRVYAILTGWVMIYFVLATWMSLPPDAVFHFTVGDNLLHTNLGLIAIFIAVMYGDTSDSE